MAADFFGCPNPLYFQEDEITNEFTKENSLISNTISNEINQNLINRWYKPPLNKKPTLQYESPKIRISKNIQDESNEFFRNKIDGKSLPSPVIDKNSVASSDYNHPPDIIDPNDGHIWRAKYCILENGILYFYRNEADANSQKAKSERSKYSLFQSPLSQVDTTYAYLKTSSTDSLSTSPMPRPFMTTTKSSSSLFDPEIMWEKRVALDCVGAVRSAENEYGKWSFVLLTPDDTNSTEDQDCLVLRSGSIEETQEWLFQIHRSLASIVREMVFQHPTGGALLPPEVHYSLVGMPIQNEPNGKKVILPNQTSIPYSPRTLSGSPCIHNSLSHGHGRNDMHRRRVREKVNIGVRSRSSSFDSSQNSKSEWEIEPSVPFDFNDESPNPIFPYETETEIDTDEKELTPIPKATPGKYIPPHMRKKLLKAIPPPPICNEVTVDEKKENSLESLMINKLTTHKTDDKYSTQTATSETPHFKLGGCADKSIGAGSIMDTAYLKRSVKLGKGRTDTYGYIRNNLDCQDEQSSSNVSSHHRPPLNWEVGAVSACGVRSSNEDAYVIANDLMHVLESERKTGKDYKLQHSDNKSSQGLFAVFDGHCGFQTARYAAEKFTTFLLEAITERDISMKDKNIEESFLDGKDIVDDLRNAIAALDHNFCNICTTEGREWGDSGATALITILSNECIYIANLGDCRGILCGTRLQDSDSYQNSNTPLSENDGWTKLEEDTNDDYDDDCNPQTFSFWKEVTNIHSPSRDDEKQRIENANGWITTEQEICIGQLQRIDLEDKDALDILKRWFSHRFNEFNEDNPQVGGSYKGREKKFKAAPGRLLTISRICGELSVSRALGDKEFKSAFNARIDSPMGDDVSTDENQDWWEGPNYLPYPTNHNQCFLGDLVSTKPEFQVLKVGAEGVMNEFLILACDGLWDVMDADDAARIARDLMYAKGWSAENSVSPKHQQ